MVQYPAALALGTFGTTNAAWLGLTFSYCNAKNIFAGFTLSWNNCSVDLTAITNCSDQ